MAQLNTSSNMSPDPKAHLSISQFPVIQNDLNEEQSIQQSLTEYSYAKNASKRYVDMLESKEDSKLNVSASLSKTFNLAVFHSPAQTNSPLGQSIRQKISNVKPVTPSHTASKEDEEAMKNVDFTRLSKSSVGREFDSPTRGSLEGSGNSKNSSETSLPKPIPQEDNRQEKTRPTTSAYKNQNPLRINRSPMNSTAVGRAVSHSPTNTGSPNFASPMHRGGGNTPSNKMVGSPYVNNGDKYTNNSYQQGQSFSEIAQIEKGMLFLRKTSVPKNTQSNNPLREQRNSIDSVPGNMSVNVSLLRETNLNSKNEIECSSTASGSNQVNNILPTQPNAWDVSQTQLKKSEFLEYKIEKLLTIKSYEIKHFTEIGSFFDTFIENLQDQGSAEGLKVKSMLRKIKSTYETFVQSYSAHQIKKIADANDHQSNLEKDVQKIYTKAKEMRAEIEVLRKENEKLLSQNKMYRNLQSPSGSVVTTGKQQPISTEDTPTASQSMIEAYKSKINEQQNTMNSMKRKEAKLIKLLYACKKRGFDLEQVYNEEVKSGGQETTQEDEELSSMSKGLKMINSQSHSNSGTPLLIKQTEFNQSTSPQEITTNPQEITENEQAVCLSATDSELYDMEQYEISNQLQANYKSKQQAVDVKFKNKLKLDFSQLGIPKAKPPAEFIIHKQAPSQLPVNPKEVALTKSKVQLPMLDLESIKDK